VRGGRGGRGAQRGPYLLGKERATVAPRERVKEREGRGGGGEGNGK